MHFVGSWPLFIIGLLYDDPTPSHSRQIAYKNFDARQLPTVTNSFTGHGMKLQPYDRCTNDST